MRKTLITVALLSLSISGCGSAVTQSKATPSATITTPSATITTPSETRFETAVKSCPALPATVLADQGKTLTMNGVSASNAELSKAMASAGIGSGEVALPMADVQCALSALDMPASISAKIEQTTSMMGMQTDTWDEIEVSWSYHPDNGFNVILVDKR
jgi:uncharacterized protein YceK